jgi:hypothetical protein
MRIYEVLFTEYDSVVFGNGTRKREQVQGMTEAGALKNFIKKKKVEGKIAVVSTLSHIPDKQHNENEGVRNNHESFKSEGF